MMLLLMLDETLEFHKDNIIFVDKWSKTVMIDHVVFVRFRAFIVSFQDEFSNIKKCYFK